VIVEPRSDSCRRISLFATLLDLRYDELERHAAGSYRGANDEVTWSPASEPGGEPWIADCVKPAPSSNVDFSTRIVRGFCTGAATSQARSGFAPRQLACERVRYVRPVSQNGPGHSNGSMRPYSVQPELSSAVCGGDTGNGSYFAGFAKRRVYPVNEIALE
jgi:hypothetical protein